MARNLQLGIRAILWILSLTPLAYALPPHGQQLMKNDINVPQPPSFKYPLRNEDKTGQSEQFATEQLDYGKEATNRPWITYVVPKCNEDPTGNKCNPKAKLPPTPQPVNSSYSGNTTSIHQAVRKTVLQKMARPKRQLRNLLRLAEGSAKIRRQPKLSVNGRMFQMQEFSNMLKARQRQHRQQQQNVKQVQTVVAPAESEEHAIYEPQYLPLFVMDPSAELMYANRLGLHRRNMESRGSRAIKKVRENHRNSTDLSDEAKRNIFFSKGWGASGSLEMSVSRESPSISQGMSDKAPYAFTSKHWGPLGKREEDEHEQGEPLMPQVTGNSKEKETDTSPQKPKDNQSQWTPFTSQSWTPLGKRAQGSKGHGYFFTSNNSWKSLGKRNHSPTSQEPALRLNLFHYS